MIYKMLLTKEDALKLDTVLSYLVRNEDARMKLKQIMDLLNTTLEDARYLYELILKYHNNVEPVISLHNALNIGKRPGITEEFLKKGGFMAVYEKQAEIKAFNELSQLQQRKKEKFYNWQKNSYWFTHYTLLLPVLYCL